MKFNVYTFVGLALVAGLAFYAAKSTFAPNAGEIALQQDSTDLADVKMPEALSDKSKLGQTVFRAKCAVCHGANAQGVNGSGPPLIHKIYEPSHHGDPSFLRAAQSGVRSHHWPFGDMPPIAGVTPADIKAIIAFIREVQRFNGIN